MTESIKWESVANVATVAFLAIMATVTVGAGIAKIIPKSVEFEDVRIIDAHSERHPTGLTRSMRYTMVVELPDGKIVEIPANAGIVDRVGETVKVKVVENYLGGYSVYVSE